MRIVFVMLLALAALPGAAASAQSGPPDKEAVPLVIPQPVYPLVASYFKVPGYCEVKFSVHPSGYAVDVKPSCSHRVFCKSAHDAMLPVRFEPAERKGKKVKRKNVIYPLEFTYKDQHWQGGELTPCDTAPVA